MTPWSLEYSGERMNRRNFIGSLLALGAGFSVLPAASLYKRRWVKAESGLWNPADYMGEWRFVVEYRHASRLYPRLEAPILFVRGLAPTLHRLDSLSPGA